MKTAIWWIRRDLRIANNLALNKALENAFEVIPLFILDPRLLDGIRSSQRRNAFLFAGLRELNICLKQRGSELIVQQGNPTEVFKKLKQELGTFHIFAEKDYSPFAIERDDEIEKEFALTLVNGLTAIHPERLLKTDGTPYRVFTPFMKFWRGVYSELTHQEITAPENIITSTKLTSDTIPDFDLALIDGFIPGEKAAIEQFNRFADEVSGAIQSYGQLRDYPATDATSVLSPYLKFGMVSAQQAFNRAFECLSSASSMEKVQSIEKWIDELIWREFYHYILFHFPHSRYRNYQSKYDNIQWDNDTDNITAWQQGLTGFPFVDAGMRQLNQTGWMHNRLRMITASFLVKNLLVDWRIGERYFMQNLIDGDTAANVGGWQWVAGTGTDAAPYFRVFNPITQGKKFDAEGVYIRRWVPELLKVPDKYIHEPWRMPEEQQRAAGCIMGENYPHRIVDLKSSRARVLTAYKT